jgi:type II secretory pathway pseudopilin PulG
MLRRIRNDQSGLTLVETLVALTVFLIVSIGITPLMLTAIRGAGVSRSLTVGKNVAVEAMERVRGLPYFVSVQGQTTPTRRDVLDLYYPDKAAAGTSGYQAGTFSYVTRCTSTTQTPAASGALACPKSMPDGTTVTYTATFVQPNTATTPQTFTALDPAAGYNWSATATEAPKSYLLNMVIEASWNYTGRTRSAKLTTIVGERTIAPTELQAEGDVFYVVEARTSYTDDDPAGRESTMEATAGISESKIENKAVAVADHSSRTGRLLVTESEFGTDPGGDVVDLSGAVSTVHAPPNLASTDVTAATQTATHPSLPGAPAVGFLGETFVDDPSAVVTNELPLASGKFQFMGGSGTDAFWIQNDVGVQGATDLLLDPTKHVLDLNRQQSTKILGESRAQATAISPSSSRKVEGYAQAQFGQLDLLPAILGGASRPVVSVSDFSASVTCTSTAQTSASVAGTWSATLNYWNESDPNDGLPAGSYVSVPLSGSLTSTATDPLAAVKASNPMVYEDPVSSAKDIYLFDADPSDPVLGYLSDWWSRTRIDSSEDIEGRTTSVSLDGAIQISTAPVNPQVPVSNVSVSIGALSCQAVDARGL